MGLILFGLVYSRTRLDQLSVDVDGFGAGGECFFVLFEVLPFPGAWTGSTGGQVSPSCAPAGPLDLRVILAATR
jgi:hypothetical protein